ncbi:ABC transporter ATP-binding protein [Paracoccus aestuariivivens]|uniref:ATP-binding cassette domain-containing protein n=1 Tax=Paracoccus aestuariivivens TaxID=1820333 RepID=A0A6L6JG33_9RHOB|nr:ABC transporter ATP-binding protein [Paracoccus aestuariivivens]MTH79699.1 ATP-binding cassette domain-containing protein [Paracoccus aestuariivivens]
MIRLENLSKSFTVNGRTTIVARNINVTFPQGGAVGLLGHNGAGKSTLLRMIAGVVRPDRGRVVTRGTVSWPVGFSGSFHPDLTGAQNTRFIARIYDADAEALLRFVEGFADLGHHFHLPFRNYSSGMRSRLAFGVSMGIHFDTYLVDEVTSVGDGYFREKSKAYFRNRLLNSGAIMVSHSMSMIRAICSSAAVLHQGQLTHYPDVNEAIRVHQNNMGTTWDEEDDD